MKDVCVRGRRDFPRWWRKHDSDCILGHMIEPMQTLARLIMSAVDAGQKAALQVLSLADGSMTAHSDVPTSVMLAHAFANLGSTALPLGVERVVIFGADASNCKDQPQGKLPSLPEWIEVKSLQVQNSEDLSLQVLEQCGNPTSFDAVVMREGLCFCQDLSRETAPPREVQFVGLGAGIAACKCCGTFILEPSWLNGRPAYRKGEFVLHWRPSECAWAVVNQHGSGDVLAYVEGDVGNPCVAHEPWFAWDRQTQSYKVHYAASCKVRGTPPWSRPPNLCHCCAGIALQSGELLSFMENVAQVLDKATPRAFALLHGGLYAGTEPEVEVLHGELEGAVRLFNSRPMHSEEQKSSGHIFASALKRSKAERIHYGEFLDGLLLSRSLKALGSTPPGHFGPGSSVQCGSKPKVKSLKALS